MKDSRIIMGMPVILEIIDDEIYQDIIDSVFDYFTYVDQKFSTYKEDSEISKINNKQISEDEYSEDMKTIFSLSEKTKKETDGFFDVMNNGICDPSGIVKGWAIHNAAEILRKKGIKNFYVEAGGDIEVEGYNKDGESWSVGIKNPFNENEIIKVIHLPSGMGIATSGTYIRGQHIYNPKLESKALTDNILSLTVIGPNIYEADRFATAAFAMGKEGINFIQRLEGFEAYMINSAGLATLTTNFEKYTK